MHDKFPSIFLCTSIALLSSYLFYKYLYYLNSNKRDEKSTCGLSDSKNDRMKPENKSAAPADEAIIFIERLQKVALQCFQEKMFKQSIELYSQSIQMCRDHNLHIDYSLLQTAYRYCAKCNMAICNYQKVVGDCTELLKIDNHDGEAYEMRGVAQYQRNELGKALKDLMSAKSCYDLHFPDKVQTPLRELIEKANSQLLQKELSDATQNKSRASRRLPEKYVFKRYLDSFYIEDDDYNSLVTTESPQSIENHIRFTQEQIEKTSSNSDVELLLIKKGFYFAQRGLLRKQSYQYQAAFDDFQKALQCLPENDKMYNVASLELATILYMKHDFVRAERYLINEKSIFGKVRLARLQYDQYVGNSRKQTKALNILCGILEMKNSPTAYFHRGILMMSMLKFNNAAADFAKAFTSSNHNFYLAKLYLGQCFVADLQLKKGVKILLETLEESPQKTPDMYNALGEAYIKMNDTDIARIQFLNAIKVDPSHPQAYANLGYVAELERKVDLAIQYYEKAIAVSPSMLIAYVRLADLSYISGKRTEAMEFLNTALEYAYSKEELKLILQEKIMKESQLVVT